MKPVIVSALVATFLVGSALPAAAHATVSPTEVAPDTEVTLNFRSVVERQVLVNKRFELIVPTQFEAVSCAGPIGWICEIDDETHAPYVHVSWDAAGLGGTPADIQFDLTVRTPTEADAGSYLMRAIQTHGDDWVEPWIYDEEPYIAPYLQVGTEERVVNGSDSGDVPACFGPAEQPESYDAHDGQRHDDDCTPGAQGQGGEEPTEPSPSPSPATTDPSGTDQPSGAPGTEPGTSESLPATGGGATALGALLVAAAGVVRTRR